MNQYFRVAFAVLSASFLSLGLAGQVAPRLSPLSLQRTDHVSLPSSVPGHAANAERLGALPGNSTLTGLTLILKRTAQQDAELAQLLDEQQDPSTPAFHHWLTPEQFGERFGLAEADLAVLSSWLESAGLHVDEVPASRNIIRFSGRAADIALAFGTPLQQYWDGKQNFYGNEAPVQLPSELVAVVQGVSGLSSYRLAGQHVRMPALPAGVASGSGTPTPQYTTTGTKGTAHYLVPWDFRQIYGMNTLISGGFDGTGIKIGVIGQSAVDSQQLAFFQGKTGQTAKAPNMLLVPNTGLSNRLGGDEDESELDLEYASGSAPGASVQFVYTGCTAASSSSPLSATTDCGNNGVFTALAYAITNNIAPILSLSYGGCESNMKTYASTTLEPLLQQANAQGQTVLVASGDAGAAGCETGAYVTVATHGLAVQYPASSTYVTAIGGTQLNSDSSADWGAMNNGSLGSASGYMAETTWNDISTIHILEASGGGVSTISSMPAWQNPYVVPRAYFRMVPDISFAASAAFHPYMVCLGDGACISGTGGFAPGTDGTGVGGTSVAVPNFAAMLAIVEQANGGGALGNVNPVLYALAAGSQSSTVFHDITTGDNTVPCQEPTADCQTGSLGYSASLGYDLATGLGSINAPGLQTALKSQPARAVTLALGIQSRDVPVGKAYGLQVNVLSNTTVVPTGTVVVRIDGVATLTSQLANGQATASVNVYSLGPHSVSATYSGDGNFDGSTTTINVTGVQAAPQIIASVFGDMVGINTPVTMSVFVNSGTVQPSGTATFTIDGSVVSAAVPFNSDNYTATYTYPGFATAGVHTIIANYSGDPLLSAASASTTVKIAASNPLQNANVTVNASPQSVSIGSSAVLSVVVKSATASVTTTPTGFVTLNDSVSKAVTVPLDANGQANFTRTFPVSGAYIIYAVYSGDNVFAISQGTGSVIVPAPPAPSISLALANTAVMIPSTGVANIGLNLSSVNGFSGPVGLTASIVSSTGAAFSGCYAASPSVLFPTPGSPASGTFSIALSNNSVCAKASVVRVPAVAFSNERPTPWRAPWSTTIVGAIFAFAMLRRRTPCGLLATLMLACAMSVMGCGGSGGGSSGTTTTTTTTPPPVTTSPTSGTYQVQVTATAQTTGVKSAGTFTLTVQ